VAFVATRCTSFAAPPDSQQRQRVVESLLRGFYERDTVTIFEPEQMTPSQGEAMQAYWLELVEAAQIDVTPDRSEQRCGVAYEAGRYRIQVRLRSGESHADKGKYMVVWEGSRDGGWNVASKSILAGRFYKEE